MIDPEKLRQRLDEVWISLGHDANSAGNELMRACALTLIAVIDENEEAEELVEALATSMREHPSRALLVRVAAGDSDLLDADVDARCWMPFGLRQQICSEHIVIRCSEKTLCDVPGVILPLVVADLPVVVWSPGGRACRSQSFRDLAGPAGRVIVDSMRVPGVVNSVRASAGKALVGDLSWTRLTRWRGLVAQIFENGLYRRELPRFSGLAVHYQGGAQGGIPPTALLLAGWMVSRLQWQESEVRERVRFVPRNTPVNLPGSLAGFELTTGAPETRVSIFRSGASCGEVRVEMKDAEPLMNRVSLPRSTDLMLLGEELKIHGPDPVYDESLAMAEQIARDQAA